MSEDFRQQLHWAWTVKRFWNAAAAEQKAGDALYRFISQNIDLELCRELRPPCQCGASTHCGNCDCCARR